jgi:signal transduction histidine kinase
MQSMNLSKLKSGATIGYALVFAFLLFLTFNLLEASTLNEPAFSTLRLLQFLRGFVATASGMLFVWVIMHRKDLELQALRDQLSRQLTDRTTEIESMRADVLAVISHRLRTPILANERAFDLLLSGDFGPVNAKQDGILKLLVENNADVLRLLDMLVDIYKYKSQTKHLDKDHCTLDEVLRETSANINVGTKSAAVAVTVESAEAALYGDPRELSKLIQHLLENATKHARSKVQVHSTVSDGMIEIAITDDGPGMSKEDVEGLFDRFYQMSSTGKYAPATGIGLCLCAQIAEAHGGKIKCVSKTGEGTIFNLILPAA